MTYAKALDVAYYFIDRANSDGKPITNKKLQKLIYYAQSWSLVLHKRKLFSEKIEAWIHGPAVAKVYRHFKAFGFSPITSISNKSNFTFSKKQLLLLDEVWRVYGKVDAQTLEALSHSETPWREAREGLDVSASSSNEINLSTMKEYYEQLLRTTSRQRN